MRQHLIVSGVLHVALVALFVLGMPPSDRTIEIPASIPIEIVDLGDITRTARVDKGEPRPEPPKPVVPDSKPAPPPPDPAAEAAAPPPPPKAPEPPKLAELPPPPRTPEPPVRQAEEPPPPPPPPVPDPEPAPAPTPKPEPKKPDPPKPEPKKPEPAKPEPKKPDPPKPEPKKPEPKKPEKPADPLANLLASVDDLKKDLPKPSAPSSPPSGATVASKGPEQPFRPSGPAIDAIRSQVGRNWNFDPGRRDSGDMVVEIRIEVARDRSVIRAQVDEKYMARYRSDPAYRASADAAVRAIMRSSPLDLLPGEFTANTYEQWRTIVFTFDPRDMF